MRLGDFTANSGNGFLSSGWTVPLLALCVLLSVLTVAGGSAARTGPEAGGDTETSLATSRPLVPFAYTAKLTARVNAIGTGRAAVVGTVQFRVDGGNFGSPVSVKGGKAVIKLSGLSPGDHAVKALFRSSAGYAASEAAMVQSVDSAPPGPEGILPCADRKVVLTAAYRRNNRVQFEGVAKYHLRGETVQIRNGGRTVARATVGADGTFWARSAVRERAFPGRAEFRVKVNGHNSWPRRLGQAVVIRKRAPNGELRTGPSPAIEARIRTGGVHRVVLARQVGCRKQKVVPVKQIGSGSNGRFRISMPRPAKGKPYAIYRLRIGSGRKVSSPIVVRPAK